MLIRVGKTRPHLLEGVEAFEPRAEGDRRHVARLAFGVRDRQAVDLFDLCLDGEAG
jgi:hypothetical protein